MANETGRLEVYYFNYWASTQVALSDIDVVKAVESDSPAAAHFALSGKEVQKLVMPIFKAGELSATIGGHREQKNLDCRLVFRFYEPDGRFRQLEIGSPMSAGWSNINAPPPATDQIKQLISLLPTKIASYIFDLATALKDQELEERGK